MPPKKNVGWLHTRLMQFVMQAYKDVRTDTAINEGPASVAHGAVLFIKQRYNSLKHKKIVLFGTGEIGETTAKNLLKHHTKKWCLLTVPVLRQKLLQILWDCVLLILKTYKKNSQIPIF